jgi:hypothetical protein
MLQRPSWLELTGDERDAPHWPASMAGERASAPIHHERKRRRRTKALYGGHLHREA